MKKADVMDASEIVKAMTEHAVQSDELFVKASTVEWLTKCALISSLGFGLMIGSKLPDLRDVIGKLKHKKKEEE